MMSIFVIDDHDRKKSFKKPLKSDIKILLASFGAMSLNEIRALLRSEPHFSTSMYSIKSWNDIYVSPQLLCHLSRCRKN